MRETRGHPNLIFFGNQPIHPKQKTEKKEKVLKLTIPQLHKIYPLKPDQSFLFFFEKLFWK